MIVSELDKSQLFSTSIRRWARVGAFLTICLLLISCFFGRKIANQYNQFTWVIPYVGFGAVAILLIGFVVFSLKSAKKLSNIEAGEILKAVVITLLAVAAMSIVGKMLIVLPLEMIHFFKYGLLCLFFSISFDEGSTVANIRKATVLTMLIGIIEESLQYFVPDRFAHFRDMILNCWGALFGSVLSFLTVYWVKLFKEASS